MSPPYVAVIELVPTGKAVVVNVATSFETVPPPKQGRAAEEGDGTRRRGRAGARGGDRGRERHGRARMTAEPGVAVRAVVVAIAVTGGDTVNVADSMNPFAPVVEVGDACRPPRRSRC